MPNSNDTDKYMVIVADDADETAGGIAFFETAEEAAAHMEALLESGAEQPNISVFAIKLLPAKVHYRPVVTITADPGAELTPTQAPAEATEPATKTQAA
jgi:hypothetical protein